MNGTEIIEKIKEYFAEVRNMKEFSSVKDEELMGGGEIYYMNGNDGTAFDWNLNCQCCEFMIFYEKTERGFLKVFVEKNGNISGYGYLDEGRGNAINLPVKHIGEKETLAIACLMMIVADNNEIYDKPISKLRFNVNVNTADSSKILIGDYD